MSGAKPRRFVVPMSGAKPKRFVVEFTEHVHRSIVVRAYDEQEATEWVEDNWDAACERDKWPNTECGVDSCYEAEVDGSED